MYLHTLQNPTIPECIYIDVILHYTFFHNKYTCTLCRSHRRERPQLHKESAMTTFQVWKLHVQQFMYSMHMFIVKHASVGYNYISICLP